MPPMGLRVHWVKVLSVCAYIVLMLWFNVSAKCLFVFCVYVHQVVILICLSTRPLAEPF
jgi:hypothetical protein